MGESVAEQREEQERIAERNEKGRKKQRSAQELGMEATEVTENTEKKGKGEGSLPLVALSGLACFLPASLLSSVLSVSSVAETPS
jgi:hypothetical protein